MLLPSSINNDDKTYKYNYFTAQSVKEMCPQKNELTYIEESACYDHKTRIMLDYFLKYKKVSLGYQPIGKYYKNICWLNETRRLVTENCCNRFVENKQS